MQHTRVSTLLSVFVALMDKVDGESRSLIFIVLSLITGLYILKKCFAWYYVSIYICFFSEILRVDSTRYRSVPYYTSRSYDNFKLILSIRLPPYNLTPVHQKRLLHSASVRYDGYRACDFIAPHRTAS
jgi:hypothetical protein